MRIAIVTEQEYLEKGWKEDNILRIKLISLLRSEGYKFSESNVVIIDWRDKLIDLHGFDAIFISSSWNAVDFPNEFKEWLIKSESDGVPRLINCKEMILKSLDKKYYFQELASVLTNQNLVGGLIPTYFTPSRSENNANQKINFDQVQSFLKNLGCSSNEIVVKPRISADGKDVSKIKLDLKNDQTINEDLQVALGKNKVKESGGMIQPFISAIDTQGEYQLLFLNGEFSHATVKLPGFGSLDKKFIKKDDLPVAMNEFSEFIANYFYKNYNIVRIRIDLILDNKKRPLLLEAEFIEPNCNTDSVYKFSIEKLGKKDVYLPCDECPEYDETMKKFAIAVYNEAKRLSKNKTETKK